MLLKGVYLACLARKEEKILYKKLGVFSQIHIEAGQMELP